MRKRILGLDIIRALAIVFVVFCHSSSHIYFLSQNSIEKSILLVFFTIGRLGVPLFLMLSGYLLMQKTYNSKDIKKFYKERWLKLFIISEIWLAIYYCLTTFYSNSSFQATSLIKQCLFLQTSPMNHAWYLGMILGFYLTIPFISNALHSIKDLRVLKFPLALLITVVFVIPLLNSFTHNLTPAFHDGFIGGYYGLYIIFGFLLSKGFLKKVKTPYLIYLTMFSFFITVAIVFYFMQKTGDFSLWYNNIFLFIAGLGLFELITRLKTIRFKKSWSLISYHSFSIFLLHNIVRLYFNVDIKNSIILFITESIAMLLVSLLISVVINRFGGKVGKSLLYLK